MVIFHSIINRFYMIRVNNKESHFKTLLDVVYNSERI